MGLTLPLVILGALFTGMQLTNELKHINQTYTMKSRFVFDSIHKAMLVAVKSHARDADDEALRPLVQRIEENSQGATVDVYNLHEHRVLFPRDDFHWDPFDQTGVEASLHQMQEGKPYHVRVNRESKSLAAFIPIEDTAHSRYLIVRVQYPLGSVTDALQSSVWTLVLMFIFIAMTGIAIGQRLARHILKPILALNNATQEIVQGHLGKHVKINTGDEIEELAKTFNHMSDTIKSMKTRAEDSNPLTHLPGNQGIFHELKKRILEKQKFVLFHVDLDRFKVFNDHFGLAKGDEAIKMTADLMRETVKERGGEDDFIGHQGGDDFVMITQPHRAAQMAEYMTQKFDKETVKALYSKEDYDRGFTLQLDRRRLAETGEERMTEFPLIAVSLAGVTNSRKDFADYFDCMSQAVAVKKEVKKIIESSFIIQD